MLVMKFGGTSVGSADAIRSAARIVVSAKSRKPVVVVSAVAGFTNTLLAIAKEKNPSVRIGMITPLRAKHKEIASSLGLKSTLLDPEFKELTALAKRRHKIDKKLLDAYISFGERLSAKLFAGQLSNFGVRAQAIAAYDLGMITDNNFGAAEPLETSYALIQKKLTAFDAVPVVTGFIGKTKKGEITTLGRGGSDYTAAIIGAAVKAEAIQIWKEVDGFMTTDPRLVPEARVVPELAFEEAAELAYFGAKVLHPKTILPAMKAGVPVQILNTFQPEGGGTTIVANFAERKQKSTSVEALTFKKGVIALHIYSPEFFDGSGLMAKIFKTFEKYATSVDLVTTSVASVSLTIDNDNHLEKIVKALSQLGDVVVESKKAIVCAVGGSVEMAGVAGKMFTVLGDASVAVEMISQASSGVSITFVVAEDDAEKAVKTLHKQFIEGTL